MARTRRPTSIPAARAAGRIPIVLGVLALLGFAGAQPAFAQTAGTGPCMLVGDKQFSCDSGFALEPDAGRAGDLIGVSGGEFAEGIEVAVYLDPSDVGVLDPLVRTSPGPDGSVQTSFEVPARTPGQYTVIACQLCLEPEPLHVLHPFAILPTLFPAELTADPDSGRVGDLVAVRGTAFDPRGGEVNVYLDAISAAATPEKVATVGLDGSFDASIVVPARPPGTLEIFACQRCFDLEPVSDSATFTIVTADAPTLTFEPTLRLSPRRGASGDEVVIVGAGWDPTGGAVEIHFGRRSRPGDPVERVLPGERGGFRIALEVPALEPGPQPVRACQGCEGDRPLEDTEVFRIRRTPPAGPEPWWRPWVPAAAGGGGLAAMGAAGLAAWSIRRHRRIRALLSRFDARPRIETPVVRVTSEGGDPPGVRLVPHGDPGTQRLEQEEP